jgi:hypothetical protein
MVSGNGAAEHHHGDAGGEQQAVPADGLVSRLRRGIRSAMAIYRKLAAAMVMITGIQSRALSSA